MTEIIIDNWPAHSTTFAETDLCAVHETPPIRRSSIRVLGA